MHRSPGNPADLRDLVVPDPTPQPIEILSGEMLCRLKVWTDSEWAALPERHRPRECAYFPGLGWVGAVPVAGLN